MNKLQIGRKYFRYADQGLVPTLVCNTCTTAYEVHAHEESVKFYCRMCNNFIYPGTKLLREMEETLESIG